MPSYFPIETTWVIAIWLIHGLRFRVAALISLSVSAMHLLGVLYSGYSIKHAGYDTVMLLMVNGIGAIACYQLEYAIRRAFLESKEVSSLATELGKLAQLDGLTGLNNRRCYDEQIERIWNQSRREQVSLSILLIDIDHFKAYNDQYGHQQGDDTLKSVARVIGACERRPLDIAARFGGEEFILVLYGQDERAGAMIAESLREAISVLQIPHGGSPTHPNLTASIGVAIIMPDTQRSCAGAIQMADEALYQAKHEGRNRVVVKVSNVSTLNTGRFRADQTATA
jgi:diguanylate cyclase (GGDEF)-like protein